MTEKLYVGTIADCSAIRLALDFVMEYPRPGYVNGSPVVNDTVRDALRAAWFAMTDQEREAIMANPAGTPYQQWSFQYTGIVVEGAPGVRRGCWLPPNLAEHIQLASAAGRTLNIAQTLLLTAAQAVWLNDFPANWIQEL